MARKSERRANRREHKARKRKSLLKIAQHELDAPPPAPTKRSLEPLHPLNAAQSRYMVAINNHQLTFGEGPAGTGKSFVCVAMAAAALAQGTIKRLTITRPAVEAGEGLGFLPGELEEKFDPYFQPVRDVLHERLGSSFVEYLIKTERIQALPLAFMRGKTFKDEWVILDEGQKTTPVQMKLFLTRIGELVSHSLWRFVTPLREHSTD